ncbi:MAG: dTDP-glucose 4,6-dehydratase [Planctomycetota bacterium]|jgi:dTDP-glucose 4,6-dehydratase
MHCLVTGGSGFIGSNLVRHLIVQGHQVLNVDALTYAGNSESLSDLESSPNYQFHRLDIAGDNDLLGVMKSYAPDCVLHLAAESHVDRSIDGPGQFIQTNIVGTYQLLQASLGYYRELDSSLKQRFRFLHISTDEVFGSLGTEGYFSETTAYDPHSPYSASKAASDHLVRAWWHTYGLPILITNCSNNYGPFQFPEKLIPVVILKCIREEAIPVYGKGENVRDWLYVLDHCKAIEIVVSRGQVGETYAVGGNNELKNIDLVRLLCRIMDRLRPRERGQKYEELITYVTDRPGHDMRYAIDASKLKRELGWEPNHDHQELFTQTVKWYLDNEAWWQSILSGQYKLERQGLT